MALPDHHFTLGFNVPAVHTPSRTAVPSLVGEITERILASTYWQLYFFNQFEKLHKCKRLQCVQKHCQMDAASASAYIWKIMVYAYKKNDSFSPQEHLEMCRFQLPVTQPLWPSGRALLLWSGCGRVAPALLSFSSMPGAAGGFLCALEAVAHCSGILQLLLILRDSSVL